MHRGRLRTLSSHLPAACTSAPAAEAVAKSDEVLYEVDGDIAIITLNAPERMNTLGGDLIPLINQYCLRADADPAVLCVIMTGAGDRAFCAGMDLTAPAGSVGKPKAGAPPPPRRGRVTWDSRHGTPDIMHGMDTPLICAMNGSAAGWGMDLALNADIRVMSDKAKLAAAFVKRGIVPESGGPRPRACQPCLPLGWMPT
jgi:enoyl-CoA hydratase/carnithine racemase